MSLDTIGNFFTIIRNGVMRSKQHVIVPHSRIKHEIAMLLKQEGFIRDLAIVEQEGHKGLKIILKYVNGESVIHELTRISKPSGRVYRGVKQFETVAGGLGISIISTSKGIMTTKRARELSLGGEILATAW